MTQHRRPDDPPLHVTVQDLAGDSLVITAQKWSTRGGVSLVLLSDDPQQDTLAYDMEGAKNLRDALTALIDAQEAGR